MSRAGPAPVELTNDCASCGLESGVVEIYDALVAACRFGVPATATCKLCGERHESTVDRELTTPMRDVPANRCPSCLVELSPSALDERRCASCGLSARMVQVAAPADLRTESALLAALDAWATREAWPSLEALVEATFCLPDPKAIARALAQGEPVEVVADPFGNMGMRTTGRREKEKPPPQPRAHPPAAPAPSAPPQPLPHAPPQAQPLPLPLPLPPPLPPPLPLPHAPPPPHALPLPPSPPNAPAPPPPPPLPSSPPRSAPPRAVVYPLVSVIAADGEIHPAERALVDRFLQGEGLAPLTDDEFRVHHPSAVAHLVPKDRREAVVQLMCETATVDGMPDESERRVIRAYATAWHVPDEKVEFWMWGYESMSTSLVRQLWMKLRRFVLSARWSETT